MKKSIKWIIGLAAAFFVCVITANILFFTAIDISDIESDVLNNRGVIFSKSVIKEIDEEKTINLEADIDLIKIEINSGNVKIVESLNDVLKATVKGKIYNISFSSKDFKFDLAQEGKTIKFKMPQGLNWNFLGLGNYFKGDIILEIPKSYAKNFDISVGSGKINLSVENKFNEFNMRVSSGNIDVEEIDCEKSDITVSSGIITIEKLISDNINIKISSGELIVNSCEAKDVKINVNSGFVKLNGYFDTLNTQINSGDVDIEAKQLTGDYDIKISSGMFKLTLPKDASYTLSGKISSGILKDNKTKNRYTGNFNNIGNGIHKINFVISSGDAVIN